MEVIMMDDWHAMMNGQFHKLPIHTQNKILVCFKKCVLPSIYHKTSQYKVDYHLNKNIIHQHIDDIYQRLCCKMLVLMKSDAFANINENTRIPYFRKIAINEVIDYFRELKKNTQDISIDKTDISEYGYEHIDEEIERTYLTELINSVLKELTDQEQLLIIMHYDEQLTYQQIAASIDSTESAVKKRFQRIRQKLKRKFMLNLYD